MAVTDIVGGTDGDITAQGFHGDVDGWTAEIGVDEATWRTFADKWKKRANVAYQMTGTFTGTIQFDAADTSPTASLDEASFEGITLTLTATTGCTYTGTANVTGVSLNRIATDRMTGSWRFGFVGQPTETWDVGT